MTEGNGEIRGLPKGWDWVKLGDVCQEIETKKPELEPEWEFQYIDIASIDNVIKKIVSPKRYLGKDSPSRARQVVRTNDIVFSTVRTYLMNIAMVPERLDDQIASTGFCVIRAADKIIPKYIFHFSISHGFINQLNELQRGTSYPAVRDRDIFAQAFPLCSTKEQDRIVEKIEELFSDVDQGVESLKTAQKQLKVYRQAVLKWAFEGKLTEAWRQQQTTLKTGEALLAQIRAERENRYQHQLAEWEEKVREWEAIGKAGKKPSKPQNPKDFSSLTQSDSSNLPEIPNSWCWEKAGNIFNEINNGYTPTKEKLNPSNGEVPFLKVYNLTHNGSLDFKDLTFIARETHELELTRSIAYPNDVLFNIVGPPLGKVSLVPPKYPEYNINQAVVVFRPNKYYLAKFLMYALLTKSVISWIVSTGKATAGQTNLKVSSCREQPLPVCSIEEQEQMVQEIESRLSICDQLEATIIENLQKAEALRQSILKQAFEGKLVPQDPSDEPAERLLERIRAERQEKESQKTSKPLRQLSLEGL